MDTVELAAATTRQCHMNGDLTQFGISHFILLVPKYSFILVDIISNL